MLTGGLRVAILAGSISAAKVALFAVGSGSFLASHPAEQLAWVYMALAAIAAASALALAPALERVRPVAAMTWLLLVTALLVAVAAAALALALPGGTLVLLILAHLYNIASEIMLWLVAAAWLPAPELRRATVWIFLATALGGFVAGAAVERLLDFGAEEALLAGTLAPMLYAALWLAASNRALGHGGADSSIPTDEPATVATGPAGTWSTLFAHPLGPPLGAASFMLTFVWVLTEFLCFARYQQAVEPAALPEFLARMYALLQLAEFACIALFAGPVTRWVPPVWRSVIFPAGALLRSALDKSGGERALGRRRRTRLHGIGLERAVRSKPCEQLRGGSDSAASKAAGRDRGGLLPFGDGGRRHGASGRLPDPERRRAAACHGDRHHRRHAVRWCRCVHRHYDRPVAADCPRAYRGGRCPTHPRRAACRARRAGAMGPQGPVEASVAGRPGGWPRFRPGPRRRVDRADRRALRQVFAQARRCDRDGPMTRLEFLLDSRSAELRALVTEAVLSLPLRRLFLPFQPALRRRYLP